MDPIMRRGLRSALLCLGVVVLVVGSGPGARAESSSFPDSSMREHSREKTPRETKTPIHRKAAAEEDEASPSEHESPPALERSSSSALWKTLLATAVCGGGAAWALRFLNQWNPLGKRQIPDQALEVVGAKPLTAQFTLHMVRVGQRILILGSSREAVCALGEVDDPVEVQQLMTLCQGEDGAGIINNLFKGARQDRPNPPVRTRTSPPESESLAVGSASLARDGRRMVASVPRSLDEGTP